MLQYAATVAFFVALAAVSPSKALNALQVTCEQGLAENIRQSEMAIEFGDVTGSVYMEVYSATGATLTPAFRAGRPSFGTGDSATGNSNVQLFRRPGSCDEFVNFNGGSGSSINETIRYDINSIDVPLSIKITTSQWSQTIVYGIDENAAYTSFFSPINTNVNEDFLLVPSSGGSGSVQITCGTARIL